MTLLKKKTLEFAVTSENVSLMSFFDCKFSIVSEVITKFKKLRMITQSRSA